MSSVGAAPENSPGAWPALDRIAIISLMWQNEIWLTRTIAEHTQWLARIVFPKP